MSRINRFIHQLSGHLFESSNIESYQVVNDTKTCSQAKRILSKESFPIQGHQLTATPMVGLDEIDVRAVETATHYIRTTQVYAILIDNEIISVDCIESLSIVQLHQFQKMHKKKEVVEFHIDKATDTLILKISKNCSKQSHYLEHVGKKFCGTDQISRKVERIEILTSKEVKERLQNWAVIIKFLIKNIQVLAGTGSQKSVEATSTKMRSSTPVKKYFSSVASATKQKNQQLNVTPPLPTLQRSDTKARKKFIQQIREKAIEDKEVEAQEIEKFDRHQEIKKSEKKKQTKTNVEGLKKNVQLEITKEIGKQNGDPIAKPPIARPIS